jgi:hypothetical protein
MYYHKGVFRVEVEQVLELYVLLFRVPQYGNWQCAG